MSGASLAAFRIAVGLVMSLEAFALFRPNPAAISTGLTPLETYYTGPEIKFHFPYEVFEWLPLLPAPWISALVWVQAVAGVTLALGLCSRVSAAAIFLSWGYLWAVESTRTYWQNSPYLECLLTFLLIWMPTSRRYSVDAWLARGQNLPKTVPFWTLFLLRGQLLIAYFYAGVAKVNADWLLDAVPVRWYLARAHVTAAFEPFLTSAQIDFVRGILHSSQFAYFIGYAGVILELAVGFLLLVRRTRLLALILLLLFHATNHFVIFDDIGWFPLLGVTTALIFLDANWPERLWTRLRHLRPPKADRGRFAAGAGQAGASLGSNSRVNRPVEETNERPPIGCCAAPFVVLWLAWQTLLPVRHHLIPGDGRFTYEGTSFSWRLKVDVRHAFVARISVKDSTILARDERGPTRINWNEWHGDKVIYRKVAPSRINWRLLPEIVVLLEPIIGERVVYNPLAGSNAFRTEAEARERLGRLWQELYGRQPEFVGSVLPLSQVLAKFSASLSEGGHTQKAAKLDSLLPQTKKLEQSELDPQAAMKTRRDVRVALSDLHDRTNAQMIAALRLMPPFALEGGRHQPAPFLLIEDSHLVDQSRNQPGKVDRGVWKHGPSTRIERSSLHVYVGGEPLIIYTGEIGAEARQMLPQACIFDFQEQPEPPAYIHWNIVKDLTVSKLTHVSNHPFYLRRYARRVAELWQKEYARRPAVYAKAEMSLNGRPHQDLVDPEADLASVPVAWLGHNDWIRNLKTARIPREALSQGRTFIGR